MGFSTLRGPPVARFLSVNDVLAKSAVLALSDPGWVGPGGRNLEILCVALAGDARNSEYPKRESVYLLLGTHQWIGFCR